MDITIDSQPNRKPLPPILFTGVDGGHDINLQRLAADGVHLLGSLRGVEGDKLVFLDNLEAIADAADKSLEEFRIEADSYARAADLKLPGDGSQAQGVAPTVSLSAFADNLDWKARKVRTVIWCTGYRGGFEWVHLPVLDEQGVARQRRGVTDCRGLYFLGLPWMHKQKSSTLFGVGEDAAYLAEMIDSK
jgi:putative flavoprotein involved in K+ transport